MELKTFRAKTMQQALQLIRQEFGPEANVLHAREVRANALVRLLVGKQVEVVASPVPAASAPETAPVENSLPADRTPMPAAHEEVDYRAKFRADLGSELSDQLSSLHTLVESLCDRESTRQRDEMPASLFEAFTDLIEADVDERTARELLETLQHELAECPDSDPHFARRRLRELVMSQIAATGPIRPTPGTRRLVALVGPTGVGKTTTIAKLAANYRLREKQRVGLITVDTYRVAAVEQLRTYADIIDLPMEVVATPKEMREAVARMSDLDLVFLDTAGRSPRDEVQIQELKSMLGEASPDEVHLVLSSTASAKSLIPTAERFAEVGATALLLTKLDEAMNLGHLLEVFRSSQLPVSYLTNGQSVPDDIETAATETLTDLVLGLRGTGY